MFSIAWRDAVGDDSHLSWHLGNRHYPVVIVIRMEHNEVHPADSQAIVLLKYIAVEVLLNAVMVVGCVGEVVQSVYSKRPFVCLHRVYLVASLPVVNLIRPVVACAEQIDGTCHASGLIVHTPLCPERMIFGLPVEVLHISLSLFIVSASLIVQNCTAIFLL